jgi:hypothetical protein
MKARVLLSVAAIAALAAGCFPNGQIPDSSLTAITPSCRISNELAAPLRAMLDAAHADGIGLEPESSSYALPGFTPPRIESCYRSLEMQQWWRNYYCFLGHCELAAVPGTSVHGWGRAIDFEDQYGELTFQSPGYAWLQANAARFGFHQPAWAYTPGPDAEAWHWEAV